MTKPETLLRAYPKSWRDRYGEEFAALLADDIAERPRCLRRDLDVVRSGLAARLSTTGAMLAALLVFAAAATSIWTQLVNGTLHAQPDTAAPALGLVTLSICGLAVIGIAAAGGVAVSRAVARTIRRGAGRALVRPAATTIAGAATLAAGVLQISSHAPATTPLSRWTWAATESISTYWIHPDRLLTLPAAEIAWMVVSPIATAVLCRGLLALVVATGLAGTWRRNARLMAKAVLLPALVTAATWVVGSQHDPNAGLRAGTLDLALIAAMTLAVVAVDAASRRPKISLA